MNSASLKLLVGRDLVRSRGALSTSGFGIVAGTAALVFFAGLGLGVRSVLLGDVFPIDKVELEPRAGAEPGLLSVILGSKKPPPSIPVASIEALAKAKGVRTLYPKLRFAFPAGAVGGKEILGKDVGAHEILADGVDPALAADDLANPGRFVDPLGKGGPSCATDADCEGGGGMYCERPSGAAAGQCSAPVPVIVSRYLVEIFNKGIAPAHQLPPVGMTLVNRASGMTFTLELGVSMLGSARRGTPRNVRARLVGVSSSAIDLGVTVPLGVVRRWNEEYSSAEAASAYSSVLIRVKDPADVAGVVQLGSELGLAPKDSKARDVSVLISGVMGLLSLVATVMLLVAASNIAYTFRVLIGEREPEIGLYRAVGATKRDISVWLGSLALAVGVLSGLVGAGVARLLAIAVDRLAGAYLPEFPFKPTTFFSFPAWLLIGGAVFGALFALAGATSAVRRATRIEPARALAREVG
jgi:putative ABC transport system permease protein